MTSICPLGEPDKNAFSGLIEEGKWMRVRDGIAMDSGCAAFGMPSDWLTMSVLEESEGSKAGQTYVAAAKDGKPIKNGGQRTIKLFSLEGERKQLTCQVAGVNKIPASVALICDNGNEVFVQGHGRRNYQHSHRETHCVPPPWEHLRARRMDPMSRLQA